MISLEERRETKSPTVAEPKELFAGYPELLTPAHIAKLTGISVQYIRKMCREGDLPAVQIGRSRWFVPKVSFIAFVSGEYE